MIEDQTLMPLVERLTPMLQALASSRVLLAVVGAPGAGKSSLAQALAERFNADESNLAAVLPMDGFHYDDALLHALGRHARKGAPDTFDVHGLWHLLQRLRRNEEEAIAVPLFDRQREISRNAAMLIPRDVRLLIVEGNYLLLNQAPWSRLQACFDVSVQLDVDEDELVRRLRKRWQALGLDEAQMAAKIDGNDLPNGRLIRQNSAPATWTMAWRTGVLRETAR